ncbi:outer membrane protein transport protein [Pseudomonas sp. UL073]|uniref:Outer membrane protein transport protein n=1 Tax=Zestomonas insulae TaxID=2809017 RepID=A0ABS2I8U1_9GAMM|nr:outer membrane protein transport protein [Pseudomonas insulae]MBM7059387.1 outer membrane protein transport protein [Pseudomonas insulae]
MTMRISPLARAVAGAAVLWSGFSQAQMAQNLTIGNPKAMAMGNAITADYSGIDAVHYNPAALTKLKGRQTMVKFLTGVMDIRADFDAPPDYGSNFLGLDDDPIANRSSRTTAAAMYLPGLGGATEVPLLFAPLAGLSINPPGSKFTFATDVYAPQALGYSRGDNDPARYQGKEVVLQRITYFSPSLGYQVNDELSVGLSIGFSHQAVALNQDFRAPGVLTGFTGMAQDALCTIDGNPFEILLNICGGDLGPFTDIANLDIDMQQSLSPTWNVGFLWEPVDWFAWGAVYQSEAKMHLQGKYRIDYSSDWQGFWQGLDSSLIGAIFSSITPDGVFDEEAGNVSMDLTYPAHFSTGIKLRPASRWQVNFDVKWTDYAAWKEFKLEFDRPLDVLKIASLFSPDNATATTITLDRDYESVWSWAVGVQYDVNDRLSLRAGFEPRPSAIPGNKADVLAPLGDAKLYGLGIGYRWDKDTLIDLGFNYLTSKQSIPARSSCNLNCSDIDSMVYNPYADLDVETSVKAYILALTYQTTF